MPERYADAVRARRAELRALRERLTGGHRDELRSALALSRLAASAEITAILAELGAEAAAHLERADRAARRQFPSRLGNAVDDTARRLYARWARALRPALLRIATTRSLPVRPDWPNLPLPRPLPGPLFHSRPDSSRRPDSCRRPDSPRGPDSSRGPDSARWPGPPAPPSAGPLRSLATGALHGVALWRLVLLPLALLPAWGMPALGGRALVPLAVGTGVAVVAVAAHARCVRVERARLRRHTEDVLTAARAALTADLGRRLIELDAGAAGPLDVAVRQRRAEIEAELAALSPTAANLPGANPPDAGPPDAGPPDVRPRDAGPRDAGSRDVRPRDAGPRDAGPRDARPADAGQPGATPNGPVSSGPALLTATGRPAGD